MDLPFAEHCFCHVSYLQPSIPFDDVIMMIVGLQVRQTQTQLYIVVDSALGSHLSDSKGHGLSHLPVLRLCLL